MLVEHSHRLAAGTVVILTLALAGLLDARAKSRRCGALRPFGWLAVGLVFVQALLGGITVLLRLPDADLDGAHGDVAAVLPDGALHRGALAAGAGRRAPAPARRRSPRLALVAAVAVYFQMVLGGLVRHSGAALACTDVPLCRGSLWPDAHPTVLIQALHRLNGVAVALLVLASSIVTLRAAPARGADLRALAVARARAGRRADLRSASARSSASSTWPPSSRTWPSRPRCSRRWC